MRIGLYTLCSRWGLRMGYRIMKGVSEQCIARLCLTLSFPCFCSKVPPTPSQEVSFSKQNKPSGIGAFNTGGLINNSLISLNAFSTSSVHLNFLDFFCKSYIGISNHLRFGKNEERKLTMSQNALVCFNVLGESRFQIASH